jgi:hypothetical protein
MSARSAGKSIIGSEQRANYVLTPQWHRRVMIRSMTRRTAVFVEVPQGYAAFVEELPGPTHRARFRMRLGRTFKKRLSSCSTRIER